MKSITGREIIDCLEKIAPLEWYKYHALSTDEQYQYAPRIVWRFKQNSLACGIHDFELFFHEAIKNFEGNVRWVASYNGKNWALVPTLVHELQKSGRFRVDTQIILEIAQNNPEYADMANHDVPRLAGHILQRWEKQKHS